MFDCLPEVIVQGVELDEYEAGCNQQGQREEDVAQGDQLQEGARVAFHGPYRMSWRRLAKVSGADDIYRISCNVGASGSNARAEN